MKLPQIEKWEKTRQLGPWKYALIYGSIWGFFVAGFVILMNYFTHFSKPKDTAGIVIMILIYWITGIILYRYIFWKAKERVYQSWKNNQMDS
jgi:amino acid permease